MNLFKYIEILSFYIPGFDNTLKGHDYHIGASVFIDWVSKCYDLNSLDRVSIIYKSYGMNIGISGVVVLEKKILTHAPIIFTVSLLYPFQKLFSDSPIVTPLKNQESPSHKDALYHVW